MPTALVIVVPEAEPVVGRLRVRHDPAGALGVPTHVTLLFPFGDDPDGLEELFGAAAPFDFALVRTAWFQDPPTLYLAPEPTQPFVELISTLVARYPDYPPYGGSHGTIVPHVTVGRDVPEDAEREIQAALPIRARAESVTWLEERPDGRWGERHLYTLGG